jgi:ABC-type amino acid transport substrate-binding protein
MWGETSVKNPQGMIVEAVAKGDIDMAIVWGPIGGYFAKAYGEQLTVMPTPSDAELPMQTFAFDIAIGVRKGDQAFAAKLKKSLERKRNKIQEILNTYN